MLTIERSIFPLAKIHVKVNDNDFVLGSNEVKTLDESNAEGMNIILKLVLIGREVKRN